MPREPSPGGRRPPAPGRPAIDWMATPRASGADLPPGVPERLGPLRLLKPLGSGAMGLVCLAELAEERPYGPPGMRVAVKLLHPGRVVQSPSAVERLLREASLGREIQDPAVVRAHDADSLVVGGTRL